MKTNNIYHILFLLANLMALSACEKKEEGKSIVITTAVPYLIEDSIFLQTSYVYGAGQTTINKDIPDLIAVAGDSVVGFEGGYGGKTGHDFIRILKSDIVSWGDTITAGGKSIRFERFNLSSYSASVGTNIVIADQIKAPNKPGPNDLVGSYKRTSNSYIIELKKVFDGVYIIDNLGGAGVPPFPYLLYNYSNISGEDSLAFANQVNSCNGGHQLVSPAAPEGLTSKVYSLSYPPIITSTSPLTFQWKIFSFGSSSVNSKSLDAGAACTWGYSIRTFVKQ